MNIKGLKRMATIFSTLVSVFFITHYMIKARTKGHENHRQDSCGSHNHTGNGHKKCSCHQLVPGEASLIPSGLRDNRVVNLQESMNGRKDQGERTAEILKSLTREIKEISF